MAVDFIIGSAGAGKSYELYKRLIDKSLENPNKNFVAVVPEQFSMETQKEILSLHKNHGSFNIEVTSFKRFALKVLEEQGITDYKVMDDLGKTIVMGKALEDCKKNLIVYKKKASMPGFTEKMKTVISELKQYSITDEILKEMIKDSENTRPALKHKLKDISTISKAFNNYINEKMITMENVLDIFCKHIPQSDIVKNTYFYIDGFTGFTPSQYKVLELLIKHAPSVSFAMTLPDEEKNYNNYDHYGLFSLSKETLSKIEEIANRNNQTINDLYVAGEGQKPYRIKDNEELCFLENNIFRSSKKQYNKECRAIEIHEIANPGRESSFVAKNISRLVIEKGYKYSDIAVITGNMDGYYRYLEEEFNDFNIPSFIDHTRDISSNPFVESITGAMDIIERDFSYESVMHFLRLGIFDEEITNIDLFENYILQSGRRGFNSYSRKWEKVYRGMEEGELDLINETKEYLLDIIKPLRASLKTKNATVMGYLKAIYQFIININMEDTIEKMADDFDEKGNQVMSKEYNQTYEAIISLLDKMASLMGEDIRPLKEFTKIIISGFESIKIGLIPPAIDVVMVGDIERTRLKDTKKIIFFIGVNDGIIPKASVSGGIITDADREFLTKNDFVLAPTARDDVFKQKVYLYSLLAKPSEKIIITYSKSAIDGGATSKSYLINEIKKVFPQLEEIDEDMLSENIQNLTTKKEALKYIAENMRSFRFSRNSNDFEKIAGILSKDNQCKQDIKTIIKGAYYKRNNEKLEDIIARRLYGNKNYIGTTRLERFASCAYSQFLSNGLNLKERKKYEVMAVDVGNLYHGAINEFFNEVKKEDISWADLTPEHGEEIIDYCVEKVVDEYENDAIESTARNLFIKNQVRETSRKTADVLIKHIQKGEFKPGEYELKVNHGRIDRMDTLENKEDIYVKVIDYKSGKKKFDITETFYGLQLQLMVYLKDAMEYVESKNGNKNVKPGAGLYFNIKNPYIKKPNFKELISKYKDDNQDTTLSDDEIKEVVVDDLKYKEFKMTGLVNNETDVIKGMDTPAFINNQSSIIAPIEVTSKGYGARSSLVNTKEYNLLLNHVSKISEKMTDEIMNGNIDVNPVKKSCTYCPYKRVCGFDEKLGDEYRKLEKIDLKTLGHILENSEE